MFDLNEIKLRATSQSYQLGNMIYHADRVSQLSLIEGKVTAIVSGEHDYRVAMTINSANKPRQGETIEASCSCPASAYQDICKHIVAVALRVENSSKETLLNDTAQQAGKQARLKEWFKQKSNDELTDIIMGYIEQSEDEEGRWQLTMLNEQGCLTASEIGKLITKALPAREVWEWNKVCAYFDHAEMMFDEIFVAIETLSVSVQWKLILKTFQRLNKVLEQIDDSGGFRFTIEGQLKERLTTLFNLLSWSDTEKAEWIFEHFQHYKYDVFPAVPDDFSLTAGVKNRFFALCSAEVEKQEQLGINLSGREQKWAIKRLITPLLDEAELVGDWQLQSHLMKKSAWKYSDFLAISELHLENDDTLDAQYYLQQAYQKAETPYEKVQCQAYEVKVRVALNEFKQAWQLSWKIFNDNPSFRAYKKLLTLQQQIGVIDPDFMVKVEAILSGCYHETERGLSRNADALLEFYIERDELEKARVWVLSHKADATNLLKLANLIVPEHLQASVDLYYRVLDSILRDAKNSAYQQATDLLIKLEKNINTNEADGAIFYLMVHKIIKKHKAKRNLMKLLKTHFVTCF